MGGVILDDGSGMPCSFNILATSTPWSNQCTFSLQIKSNNLSKNLFDPGNPVFTNFGSGYSSFTSQLYFVSDSRLIWGDYRADYP
jgi:hypothetical protein